MVILEEIVASNALQVEKKNSPPSYIKRSAEEVMCSLLGIKIISASTVLYTMLNFQQKLQDTQEINKKLNMPSIDKTINKIIFTYDPSDNLK